jgi:hypothetical protein
VVALFGDVVLSDGENIGSADAGSVVLCGGAGGHGGVALAQSAGAEPVWAPTAGAPAKTIRANIAAGLVQWNACLPMDRKRGSPPADPEPPPPVMRLR